MMTAPKLDFLIDVFDIKNYNSQSYDVLLKEKLGILYDLLDRIKPLSDEEIKELNIPDYKDLNIYMLPNYDDLNHKDIMTLYVKRNIYDKEIRQALFYALRNYDYMDKFYDNLRRYGLFKDYLEYSNYYYEQIIKDWKIKNNIDKN